MRMRSLVTLSFATIGLICLLLAGCSDDSIIITNAGGSTETLSELEEMFPATAGYQVVYEVTQSNGLSEIVTNTVGEEIPFGYTTAHEMHVRSSSGERYTNYFIFGDSSLYFYEYWSDNAEKILALPMTPGTTWDKYDPVDDIIYDDTDGTVDTSDNQTDNIKGGDNGGIFNKNFPGNNAGAFTIEATETIALSSGDIYSGTVRIRNDGGTELTNYFWFAPRVGLVRWVLEADPMNIFDGSEVGELIQRSSTR